MKNKLKEYEEMRKLRRKVEIMMLDERVNNTALWYYLVGINYMHSQGKELKDYFANFSW